MSQQQPIEEDKSDSKVDEKNDIMKAESEEKEAETGEEQEDNGNNNNDGKYGLSDEEFQQFLKQELEKDPLHLEYPNVFKVAPYCICQWRKRYRGKPRVWKRLFQKDRVIKEFVESAPIIDAVQRLVLDLPNDGQKYTIVDLACGRGYLSMILSELLPPEKVKKFILVDKAWPVHGLQPQPHHISWTHIYGGVKELHHVKDTYPNYFQTWPIPLHTSKQDLKAGKSRRKMQELFFHDQGPIILVAIHLCGTLSLRAVELFNDNPNTKFLCLKPCCLPDMVHAKRHEVFKLGQHKFDAKDVCMAGRWKKNVWKGPARTHLKSYFERWVDNLFLGIDDTTASGNSESSDGGGSGSVQKIKKTVLVQRGGGYQNEFLFAERQPTTSTVWNVLQEEKDAEGALECQECKE